MWRNVCDMWLSPVGIQFSVFRFVFCLHWQVKWSVLVTTGRCMHAAEFPTVIVQGEVCCGREVNRDKSILLVAPISQPFQEFSWIVSRVSQGRPKWAFTGHADRWNHVSINWKQSVAGENMFAFSGVTQTIGILKRFSQSRKNGLILISYLVLEI